MTLSGTEQEGGGERHPLGNPCRAGSLTADSWRSVRATPSALKRFLRTRGHVIKHAPLIAVRRELHSDCLALLQAPHIQETAQLTLPLDINNYPFYRYVQIYFRVRCAQQYIYLQISP